jgi:mono/diheme cytochrome c family protein
MEFLASHPRCLVQTVVSFDGPSVKGYLSSVRLLRKSAGRSTPSPNGESMLFLTSLISLILFLHCISGTAVSSEINQTQRGKSLVGDTTALPGTTKEYGPGRCTLCHAFNKATKSHYFIGPNLSGITDRAAERLKDPRYHLGHPQARKTVIREAYPGSGTATTALEYIAESLVCVSCYVVPGYGEPGTYDRASPEIEVTQPPYNLRLNDLVAVISWLYVNDGKTPPAISTIEAALSKFLTPLEHRRLTGPPPEPLPTKNPTVLASGEESLEDMFTRAHCVACHVIPGVPQATGSIGPPLTMGSVGEQRLKDPEYKGTAHTPREFVIESILYPRRYVAHGHRDNVMPAVYGSNLTTLVVERMADYLLTLHEGQQPTVPKSKKPTVEPPFFPPYRLATSLSLHDAYADTYAKLLTAEVKSPS